MSRAAASIGVSASAVSRMIGLLEADVGQPLFTRVGRRIELNAAGVTLLAGVRSAMRLVDESLTTVHGGQFVGPVRVSSAEPVTRAYVLPALRELCAAHPALVPELTATREDMVGSALLRGSIDVAFVRRVPSHAQLSTRRLGAVTWAVYAGHSHPIVKLRAPKLSDVLGHRFVALEVERAPHGPWRTELKRSVALWVDAMGIAAEIVARGELLGVLPTTVAERHHASTGAELHRLAVPRLRSTEVFAVWREQLELAGRAEAVVDRVGEVVAAAS